LKKAITRGIRQALWKYSKFVSKYGLEAFMAQQKDKYTCSKCGGIISIHDRECSECQEKMNETSGL
jgi:ribosomal protein S27AE